MPWKQAEAKVLRPFEREVVEKLVRSRAVARGTPSPLPVRWRRYSTVRSSKRAGAVEAEEAADGAAATSKVSLSTTGGARSVAGVVGGSKPEAHLSILIGREQIGGTASYGKLDD